GVGQRLRLPGRPGRADVLGRTRRPTKDRRTARLLVRQDRQGGLQPLAAAAPARRFGRFLRRRGESGRMSVPRDIARPLPWAKSYPAGFSPDVVLDMWPVPEVIRRSAERFGERNAFEFRGGVVSYRRLAAEMN